jgi:hypothetical protein
MILPTSKILQLECFNEPDCSGEREVPIAERVCCPDDAQDRRAILEATMRRFLEPRAFERPSGTVFHQRLRLVLRVRTYLLNLFWQAGFLAQVLNSGIASEETQLGERKSPSDPHRA